MPRKPSSLHLLVAALAMVSGCQGCFGCKPPTQDPNDTIPTTCLTDPPLIEPTKLDILFVIDSSNSMMEEQDAVARELTGFIDEIRQTGGVRQDFNVGVLTTSVYQHTLVGAVNWWQEMPRGGLLRPVPDVTADGGLILETANERVLNGEDPQLIEKFGRLVRQGTRGSGQETPFEAVRLALLGAPSQTPLASGGNGGFLRDGARLLVVVLTDEDDCSEIARPSVVTVSDNSAVADCTVQQASLTTVSEYHRLFTEDLGDGLGGKREVIWTAIAPVGISTKAAQQVLDTVAGQVRNIDCPTSNQAGYRHRAMAEAFDPSLANLDSICRASFRETLIRIAELAGVSQIIEMSKVPSIQMLQLLIRRKDGTREPCTSTNQGFEVLEPGGPGKLTKVRFQNQCRRRADDLGIEVRMLCAT